MKATRSSLPKRAGMTLLIAVELARRGQADQSVDEHLSVVIGGEALAGDGSWIVQAEQTINLVRNDVREAGDSTPVSDADNYRYVYWADFLDAAVLTRDRQGRERLRVIVGKLTVEVPFDEVTWYDAL